MTDSDERKLLPTIDSSNDVSSSLESKNKELDDIDKGVYLPSSTSSLISKTKVVTSLHTSFGKEGGIMNAFSERKHSPTIDSSKDESPSLGNKNKMPIDVNDGIDLTPSTSSLKSKAEGAASIETSFGKEETTTSKQRTVSPTSGASNYKVASVRHNSGELNSFSGSIANLQSITSVTGSEEINTGVEGTDSLNSNEDREDKRKGKRSLDGNSPVHSEDESQKRKRAKNRLSAHQSRLRKKQQLDSLQEQVIILAEENKRLELARQDLTRKLDLARAENTQLRCLQQDAMQLAAAMQLTQGSTSNINGIRFFPPNL